MKNSKKLLLGAGILLGGFGVSAASYAQDHMNNKDRDDSYSQSHILKKADGTEIGEVALKETEKGVLLKLDLNGLESGGTHGFHIHETGQCVPDFSAAGGHYNPADNEHGMMVEEGQHAGDMPNIHVDEDGTVTQEILNSMITLEKSDTADGRHTIFDEDGSAIIIHAGADDYMSQPSGAAGDRIACAVIAEPEGKPL